MARKLQGTTTPAKMAFEWLNSIRVKHDNWAAGALRHRQLYEAWSDYLLSGLGSQEFMTQLAAESDVWNKAKIVGRKVSELAANYRQLPAEAKAQLARQTETELRTAAKLASEDKRQLLELVSLADP